MDDDDVDMSGEPTHGLEFQLPPSPHDLDQLQYHISLQEIGEKLQKAANAAFPNSNRLRYKSVYVLLLCWEDEDPRLPVSIEINELQDVFVSVYHYHVDIWKIPSEGSHKRLNQKVLDFVELGDDNKDDLKIVYYGGHGGLARNRQPCWTSRPDFKDSSYQMVKWSGIQHALEEAESDVLLLLDCCASGTANTDVGHGVTELIAACGFNTMANPVGPDSFTRALITELRLLSSAPSFTVGSLYNKMLCRIQNWMPAGREMQKPPLHVVLTQNRKLPQSIQLSPIRLEHSNISSLCPSAQVASQPESDLPEYPSGINKIHTPSQISASHSSSGTHSSVRGSSPSSASSVFSDVQLCPRIAITIRLKETLTQSDLSAELFADWVRMMPVLADHVKVEAGFASCSTLLVISIPLDMWCYLQDDPAISLMGLIKSSNFVSGPYLSLKTTLPIPLDPLEEPIQPLSNRPTVSSLGWSARLGWGSSGWEDIPDEILDMYDFVVPMSDEPHFGLRPGFEPSDAIPERIFLDPHNHTVAKDDSFRFSTKLMQTTLKLTTSPHSNPRFQRQCCEGAIHGIHYVHCATRESSNNMATPRQPTPISTSEQNMQRLGSAQPLSAKRPAIHPVAAVENTEAGTLVVFIEWARYLRNKALATQDPYCTVSLRNEVKKTLTYRRGGQAPRWNQEFLFAVSDSTDLDQLKVSILNDDKETTFIGATSIDLREVLASGGSFSGLWHNLSCRGKPAGEIKIHFTYYHTRLQQGRAADLAYSLPFLPSHHSISLTNYSASSSGEEGSLTWDSNESTKSFETYSSANSSINHSENLSENYALPFNDELKFGSPNNGSSIIGTLEKLTLDTMDSSLQCSICQAVCNSAQEKLMHINTSHPKCVCCPPPYLSYITPDALDKHMMSSHLLEKVLNPALVAETTQLFPSRVGLTPQSLSSGGKSQMKGNRFRHPIPSVYSPTGPYIDPNCAICSQPMLAQCECEANALDVAVRQAESRMMALVFDTLRSWVRKHAQDYILSYFNLLTTRHRTLYTNNIRRITDRAYDYYHAPPHPSEVAAAEAELQQHINENWKASVQRFPEVLEYFFGLVDISLPTDEEPSVKHPPLIMSKGGKEKSRPRDKGKDTTKAGRSKP